MGVCIFREKKTFDTTQANDFDNFAFENGENPSSDQSGSESVSDVDEEQTESSFTKIDPNKNSENINVSKSVVNVKTSAAASKNILCNIPRMLSSSDSFHQELSELSIPRRTFRKKIKNATIDVWWLYDDGGLTLLIPHLLSLPKSYLQGAKLRIFSMASNKIDRELETANMSSLLKKFRIDCNAIFMVPETSSHPSDQTIKEFDGLIKPFLKYEANEAVDNTVYITANEVNKYKEKTFRHLRARELLLEHSKDATLVVLTLPIPRMGSISAYLYLAWLEMLSKDLCPVLFVRGNQQSVLTFYS